MGAYITMVKKKRKLSQLSQLNQLGIDAKYYGYQKHHNTYFSTDHLFMLKSLINIGIFNLSNLSSRINNKLTREIKKK